MPYERPAPNTRLKAYIVEVRRTAKGPQIVVSRTHPGLILELFKLEVPEIADGIVELRACAREPGHRTKIAVWSNDSNVDPVGACVGARGARVRQVVNELNGEKIDIVPFSDDPYDFVMKALSPAKVKEVRIDVETGTATVIVPDFQLSLAIGKEGQNARLAARLTGWRVDIKSETQLADEEAYQGEEWAQGEWVVDPETGEQVWVPAEGGPALSAEQWAHAGDDEPDGRGRARGAPTSARGRGRGREPEPRPRQPPSDAARRQASARRDARRPKAGRRGGAPRRRGPASGAGARPARTSSCGSCAAPTDRCSVGPYTARSRSLALCRVPPLRAASSTAQRLHRALRAPVSPDAVLALGPAAPRDRRDPRARSESCGPSGSCEDGRPWCGRLAATRPVDTPRRTEPGTWQRRSACTSSPRSSG